MLNFFFSWVNLYGVLPFSAANLRIKRWCFYILHPENFLKKYIRERGSTLKLTSAVVLISCLGVSSLWKIVWTCQRSEILFSVVLLESVRMNSTFLTMLILFHSLLHLLCCKALHSACHQATEQAPSRRSGGMCPLGFWSLTLGFVCKCSGTERWWLMF